MKKIRILYLLLVLQLSINFVLAQDTHFSGTWTKINTTYVFEFDLFLNNIGTNKVEGYFDWKIIKLDENSNSSIAYYKNKIGHEARELVRGYFDPGKNEYHLGGYAKKDPHQIIGLDNYVLKLNKQGEIHGNTKANNSWLGRIEGSASRINL